MSLTDWIVLSPVELSAVFAVVVNCQLLRKDTGIPQYVLFVLSMKCLVHIHTCFPNEDAPIGYNFIASQIMDYRLCIVGQRWKYTLLLIEFVHLHRVICLIHV